MKVPFAVLAIVAIHLNVLHAAKDFEDFPSEKRHIIIENGGSGCRIAANFRAVFDDFHNGLRQDVALGRSHNNQHFQKRLMYGLIYDCELEQKAAEEIEKPGSAKDYGVVSFTTKYERSVLKAVREGLEGLVSNAKVISQVIHPKATRYGCSGILRRENGTRVAKSTCVYDKKAEADSLITKEACTKNEDCVYYPNSTCLWHLCYAKEF